MNYSATNHCIVTCELIAIVIIKQMTLNKVSLMFDCTMSVLSEGYCGKKILLTLVTVYMLVGLFAYRRMVRRI